MTTLISRENFRFFFGWKTCENVVVLDFLAVDNFDFTRKIVKKIGCKTRENVGVLSKFEFLDKNLTFRIVCLESLKPGWHYQIFYIGFTWICKSRLFSYKWCKAPNAVSCFCIWSIFLSLLRFCFCTIDSGNESMGVLFPIFESWLGNHQFRD